MAEWVEKGSIKGPPGEIPDVSDFLRDGDVSSAISGSAEKVASDKAVKDYVDAQVSAEATSRQEQDSSLQGQIAGKANVEHTHEISDVTGLNDKISEIETNVSGKANATHTHITAQVDGLDTKLSGIDDDIAAKADKVHTHAIADVTNLQTTLDGKAASVHTHEIVNVNGLQDALDAKVDEDSFTLASLGVTATAQELNHMSGVTSGVQAQLDGKAATSHTHATADVTGLDSALSGKSDVGHTHEIANVNGLQTALDGKAASVHEHSADNITSGVLSVDRIPSIPDAKIEGVSATKLTGTVPQSNLPSYVDDVIEADNYDALPPTGEAGKIYVDKETNKTYRWGGSAYVEISASLALGETSATAFRGDYGKVAYDHAQAKGSEFASGLYKVETNAEGHVVNATPVSKGDITALGIPSEDTDTTYTAGSGLTLSGTEFGIADDGIIGRYLDDNCVMERNIAVGAVTSDKIPALAITTPKLADNAVTAMKMADDAVATRSIQDKAVTADKIADGVIPESVSYDVATSEADGLMSSEDKTALDNLKTNAITTDASGFVQKSPIKFRGYEDGIELDITSKTETSFDLDMRSPDGTSLVTITGDELFGQKTSAITMGGDATFTMNDKGVKGITDVVGGSADGTKLATDKAVKDAIAAIEIPDPLPTGGTDGQVLTKTADGEAWEDIPDYENATTGHDGLMSAADKKKLDGIADGADKLPDGGTDGQVLTKTASGEEWANVPAPDISDVPRLDSGKMKSLHQLGITDLNNVTEPGTYVGASGLGGYPTISNLPDGFLEHDSGAIPVFYIDVYRFDTPDDMGLSDNWLIQKLYPMYESGVGRAYIRRRSIDSGAEWYDWFGIGVPPADGNTEVGYVLMVNEHGQLVWDQVPQPDMTGVVKMSDGLVLESDGSPIEGFIVSSASDMTAYTTVSSALDSAGISVASTYGFITIGVADDGPRLTISDKSVTSITDSISASPSGNALATDKAVKSYVDAHGMPSVVPISKGGTGVTSEDALVQLVFNSTSTPKASATQYGVAKFASDEDFKAYMGIS